jgi:hypothetical protein
LHFSGALAAQSCLEFLELSAICLPANRLPTVCQRHNVFSVRRCCWQHLRIPRPLRRNASACGRHSHRALFSNVWVPLENFHSSRGSEMERQHTRRKVCRDRTVTNRRTGKALQIGLRDTDARHSHPMANSEPGAATYLSFTAESSNETVCGIGTSVLEKPAFASSMVRV